MGIIQLPNSESIVEMLKNSPFEITRTLSERSIVPKDWSEYDLIAEMAVESGSSVVECAYMEDYELDWATKHNTSWYRSKEKKGGDNPFTSFMLNKKWTLEEELN